MKQYRPHKHNWQTATRHKYGAIFYLHVCTEHEKPEIQAYHMEVEDPFALQGKQEWENRTKKGGTDGRN